MKRSKFTEAQIALRAAAGRGRNGGRRGVQEGGDRQCAARMSTIVSTRSFRPVASWSWTLSTWWNVNRGSTAILTKLCLHSRLIASGYRRIHVLLRREGWQGRQFGYPKAIRVDQGTLEEENGKLKKIVADLSLESDCASSDGISPPYFLRQLLKLARRRQLGENRENLSTASSERNASALIGR
jgi:hypothetical protein